METRLTTRQDPAGKGFRPDIRFLATKGHKHLEYPLPSGQRPQPEKETARSGFQICPHMNSILADVLGVLPEIDVSIILLGCDHARGISKGIRGGRSATRVSRLWEMRASGDSLRRHLSEHIREPHGRQGKEYDKDK